jgi:hypothetical protein
VVVVVAIGIVVVVVTFVAAVVGVTNPPGEREDANDVSEPVAPESALGVVVVVVETDWRVSCVFPVGFDVAPVRCVSVGASATP